MTNICRAENRPVVSLWNKKANATDFYPMEWQCRSNITQMEHEINSFFFCRVSFYGLFRPVVCLRVCLFFGTVCLLFELSQYAHAERVKIESSGSGWTRTNDLVNFERIVQLSCERRHNELFRARTCWRTHACDNDTCDSISARWVPSSIVWN